MKILQNEAGAAALDGKFQFHLIDGKLNDPALQNDLGVAVSRNLKATARALYGLGQVYATPANASRQVRDLLTLQQMAQIQAQQAFIQQQMAQAAAGPAANAARFGPVSGSLSPAGQTLPPLADHWIQKQSGDWGWVDMHQLQFPLIWRSSPKQLLPPGPYNELTLASTCEELVKKSNYFDQAQARKLAASLYVMPNAFACKMMESMGPTRKAEFREVLTILIAMGQTSELTQDEKLKPVPEEKISDGTNGASSSRVPAQYGKRAHGHMRPEVKFESIPVDKAEELVAAWQSDKVVYDPVYSRDLKK
eukprot:g12877.t1